MLFSTARRGFALPALAFALAIGVPQAPAFADVLDALDAARDHYEAGELSRTLRELQYATEGVSAELTRAYAETFPEAPDGWEAGEADVASGQAQGMAALGMGGGGQSVSRDYRELEGDGSLEASLMVDNPMMQMMTGMLSNPAMAQASGYNRVRVGRDDAMLKFEGNQGEVLMIVDGRILLRIEGRGLDGDDVLREMMTSWNIDDVRRVASN